MAFNKLYGDHDMTLRCNKFQRLLEDMAEFWEDFTQASPFIIRLLIFSLSVVTVFKTSGAAVSGLYDNDLIIISNCSSVPQTSCPTAKEFIAFREQCINGFRRDSCPDGTTYLCGVVPGYFIETCEVDKECWPGTSFNFVMRNGTATVECVRCADGTFETEYTKSSQRSHVLGCTYRHIPQDDISSNLVLYENGTHATPSIYRCKTEEGFYDEYGNKFCNDIPTHQCSCIFKHCQNGYKLHPIGVCVRCNKTLRPENDWRCEDHITDQTTNSSKSMIHSTVSGSSDGELASGSLSTSPGKIRGYDVTSATHPLVDTSPSSPDGIQTDSYWAYIAVGIPSGIVIIAVLLLIYTCRSDTACFNFNRVSKVYHVSDCKNVLLGKNGKIFNQGSNIDEELAFEENHENDVSLPDNLKLTRFKSEIFLQDNDRDQTERKMIDDCLPNSAV